jgi:hypothetical protein
MTLKEAGAPQLHGDKRIDLLQGKQPAFGAAGVQHDVPEIDEFCRTMSQNDGSIRRFLGASFSRRKKALPRPSFDFSEKSQMLSIKTGR